MKQPQSSNPSPGSFGEFDSGLPVPAIRRDPDLSPIERRRPNHAQQHSDPLTAANIEQPALIAELDDAMSAATCFADLLRRLGKLVVNASDCLGLWGIERNEQGDLGAPVELASLDSNVLWPVIEPSLDALILQSRKNEVVACCQLEGQQDALLLVSPLVAKGSTDGTVSNMSIVGCFSTEAQTSLRLQWLLSFVTQAIAQWQQRHTINQLHSSVRSLKDAFAVIESLNQTQSVSAAGKIFVNHVQRMTGADQVVVAFGSGPTPLKIESISGVESIDFDAESVRTIQAACQLSFLRNETEQNPTIEYQLTHTPKDASELALSSYCKENQVHGVFVVPLLHRRSVEAADQTEQGTTNTEPGPTRFGVALIAIPEEKLGDDQFASYSSQLIAMLSGHLELSLRANESLAARTKRSFGLWKRASWLRVGLVMGALFCGAMLIPMPYRVHCDCSLQPTQRRFVAAPYEGILESSFVESGDLVAENAVIAKLDGRQLRMELSGLQADLEGAKKRRDSSLANGDIAQSQIAKSEMMRHRSSISILEQQLKHLEVQSPIDGVIVSGDLQKAHGAPVEMGQTLFEIAPLDEMIAEVAIPETEVAYVTQGMSVTVKLDAYPFESFVGTVTNIHPQTEIVDDESVFIADVKIENSDSQIPLRPGMKGSAKISTSWSILGWNLFHRPWESVRYWTVW
ncbi:MAG: HlyD family efflux transporter periplasmic adaptor subunit [Planctomycetota bacterium]